MIRVSAFFIVLFVSAVLTGCSGASSEEWLPVVSNGFGMPAQNTAPEVEVFEGWLYVSTAVATGYPGRWFGGNPVLAWFTGGTRDGGSGGTVVPD